jgi:hypothetical protein
MFGDDARPFADATVHIWVEDTTYADAPAIALARWTQPHVSRGAPPELSIAFDLTMAERPPSANARRLTLRALVDLDGDGEPSVGDYVNVESIRIPAGDDVRVDVNVTRVKDQRTQGAQHEPADR